jgi:hypothetical protein
MGNPKDEKIIKGKGGIRFGGKAPIKSTIKSEGGIQMGGKAFIVASVKPKDKRSKDLFYSKISTSAEITLDISQYLNKEGTPLQPNCVEIVEETVELIKKHWWEGIELAIGIPDVAGITFKVPAKGKKIMKKILRYGNK